MKTLSQRQYDDCLPRLKDGSNFYSILLDADKYCRKKDIEARINYIKNFGIRPDEWYAELKYDLASMSEILIKVWSGKHIVESMVYDKYYPSVLKRYFKNEINYIEISGSYGRFCYAYSYSDGRGEPAEWGWSCSKTIDSIINHDLMLLKKRDFGFSKKWFRVPGMYSPSLELDIKTGEII